MILRLSHLCAGIVMISMAHGADVATPTPSPTPELPDVELLKAIPPIGTVLPYAGSEASLDASKDWLICDGRWLPTPADKKDPYWALYLVIGETYGSQTTPTKQFRLPDLRGRVPVGKDDMGSQGAAKVLTPESTAKTGLDGLKLSSMGGAATALANIEEMPKHKHDVSDSGHTHSAAVDQSPGTRMVLGQKYDGGGNSRAWEDYTSDGNHPVPKINISSGNATIVEVEKGGDQPHSLMQPSIILNYIIRYK